MPMLSTSSHWVTAAIVAAVVLQCIAVGYGVVLLRRRHGADVGWLLLLGGMLSMLTWRVVVLLDADPPVFFNPLIALWGSACMLGAMTFFGREVARRQRAELERDALLESERAARSEAERASRIKDDFLATLSHELRTPLSAILGWCAVVKDGRSKRDEIDRAVEVIERNARVQSRLIEDLLDVTRLHAGSIQLARESLRLDGPVLAAVQAARLAIEAKALHVDFRTEGDVPCVDADAGRPQQVVSNLLTNAVKFTPRGGEIRILLATLEGKAQLTIADDGEGIDPSFLPQLFTRFRQADSSTTRRHGGLGLGLSIVSDLVRLHGGEVRAHSAGRGAGATFTVTLPLSSRTAATSTTSISPDEAQPDLQGVRVLLIDDEPDVRAVVSRILEKNGASVTALDGGAQVAGMLAQHRPHVLLLDIGMPGEDGYALIRRIRGLAASAGGQTPAISLTAHAREEDRARALAARFQNHLLKPVEVPSLIAAVRALLSPADLLDSAAREPAALHAPAQLPPAAAAAAR